MVRKASSFSQLVAFVNLHPNLLPCFSANVVWESKTGHVRLADAITCRGGLHMRLGNLRSASSCHRRAASVCDKAGETEAANVCRANLQVISALSEGTKYRRFDWSRFNSLVENGLGPNEKVRVACRSFVTYNRWLRKMARFPIRVPYDHSHYTGTGFETHLADMVEEKQAPLLND